MTQVAIEALLRQKIGLDALAIGSDPIVRSVSQRMAACGLTDVQTYLTRLQTSTEELEELIEMVVVPETWFFRDREPFVFLNRYVRQEWLPAHPNSVLRVLSVPCATGEEPYSIAIALQEAGLSSKNFCIDAIDISKKSLLKARRAIYTQNSFRVRNPGFPFGKGVDLRERYFTQAGDEYQLYASVSRTVNFMHGNLLDPYFPSNKKIYDIIFCRNVLIYFDRSARERTVRGLGCLLKNKGVLFVGSAETGQIFPSQFVPVLQPLTFAYRKMEDTTQESQVVGAGFAVPLLELGVRNQIKSPSNRPHPTPLENADAPGVTTASRTGTVAGSGNAYSELTFQPSNPLSPISNPQTSTLETARHLADGGRLAEAASLCETYLRQNRTSAEAYLLLGQVHQAAGNDERAEQCFQKSIYLEPDRCEALMHLALLKEHCGDTASAAIIRQRIQRLQKLEIS
jgi:chemotaxis protein methyltransferase WspC